MSIATLVNPGRTFKPAALRAVKDYALAKPWRGDNEQRQEKARTVLAGLAAAYDIVPPLVEFRDIPDGCINGGAYVPETDTILLGSSPSVLSTLYAFGLARYGTPRRAMGFAINAFRKAFPASFARLDLTGAYARRMSDDEIAIRNGETLPPVTNNPGDVDPDSDPDSDDTTSPENGEL